LWIWCWRWGLWVRRGEIWDRQPPARRAYASERVGSLRRDGVLALGLGDAPGGDLGPTESSPSGGMGSGRPICGRAGGGFFLCRV
jgi:hypothetical protein